MSGTPKDCALAGAAGFIAARYLKAESSKRHEVTLSHITARGRWYGVSWKGSDERSGGVVTKYRIYFLELLLWLVGVSGCEVHIREPRRMAGFLELERASVRWFLSTDIGDLPFPGCPGEKTTFRSIPADGAEVEFSRASPISTRGFTKKCSPGEDSGSRRAGRGGQARAGHGFDQFQQEVSFSPIVNWFFDGVMRVDEALIRLGASLPFGGSLVAVSRKRYA